MCVPFLFSYWWIFPLIGMLMCVGFLVIAFGTARRRGRFMCMAGEPHDDRGRH